MDQQSQGKRPAFSQEKKWQWQSYSFGTESDKAVGDIVVDDYGQKWMTLPLTGGLLVFDENVNGQQRYQKFSDDEGRGNLPSAMVTAIAKDKEGRIWMGTQDGLGVIYDPSDVFSGR
jgi:ligand-binding sensor domain-containing protein